MDEKQIEQDIKEYNKNVQLLPYIKGRFMVSTNKMFDDGDHYTIVLKKNDKGKWIFSDEGSLTMRFPNMFPSRDCYIARTQVYYKKGEAFVYISDFSIKAHYLTKNAAKALGNYILFIEGLCLMDKIGMSLHGECLDG